MSLFLTVHARYQDVQWGLFDEDRLLGSSAAESKSMNKQFIELLDALLRKNGISLQALSFVAVHQGPAPFTTLRVSIATVNGIGFATGLPLVGINGLDAFLDEVDGQITVALLNAFGEDVYYGIKDANGVRSLGYAHGHTFLHDLKAQFPDTSGFAITFVGNAVPLYQQTITDLFGSQAHCVAKELVSLERVAHNGYHQWKKKEIQTQVMPLYLKEYSPISKR